MCKINHRISNEAQGTTTRTLQFHYMLASVDVEIVYANEGLEILCISRHHRVDIAWLSRIIRLLRKLNISEEYYLDPDNFPRLSTLLSHPYLRTL
jgi:hypothetical protein